VQGTTSFEVTVAQLVKKFNVFCGTQGALLCSQEFALHPIVSLLNPTYTITLNFFIPT
jgi:hypothetical protein